MPALLAGSAGIVVKALMAPWGPTKRDGTDPALSLSHPCVNDASALPEATRDVVFRRLHTRRREHRRCVIDFDELAWLAGSGNVEERGLV